ncbi:MAG: gliding motility-associated C-terminal domain-containing protein [Bacteroidetes bacterium]|nr:gliding motility-associated C-terminal domain-containing protein [Bacteroidota bacterium]
MKLKYIILLLVGLSVNLFYSQTLTTSLTACYALNGNGAEPINNLTGTLSAVTATVDRFSNPSSAFHFAGLPTSYIALPNSPLLKPTNAVSFSAWVKLDNITQPHYIVFAHNTCASYHEGYTLIAQNLGPGFKLHVVKSSGACSPATQQVISSATNMVANTWYHIGAYIGNDSLKVYLNGVLQGSAPTIIPFNYNATESVYLGGTGIAFNLPLLGSLDNVRFYNRKLTDGEFNQLFLTDPSCVAAVTNPNCNTSFYALTASGVSESNLTIPNTSTLTGLSLPPGASGLAVGPAFGFPAPNPTYWTTSGGLYWYYNGTSFINTFHSTTNAAAVNPGGSKNFIYNLVGSTGQVYKYNGTGAATLLATIPALLNSGPYDVTGDDQDNFYYLRTLAPQALQVYSPTGVLTCSYSVTGLPIAGAGGGFAIVGNTVTVNDGTSNYYVGTISGNVVNFTVTPASFSLPSDFANCYIDNSFTSTITANPSATLSCLSTSIGLVATSTLGPLSYSWAGPGIISVTSNTANVNAPGVYTCTLSTTTGCPIRSSIANFTVYGGSVPTPTITLTNSLSCTNPTATLTVAPNSGTNTYLWGGAGPILPSFTGTFIIVNTGGTYSVTVTNTVTGCSNTQTINVSSSIPAFSVTAAASATQICLPSAAITLTANGATNYTWTPIGSTIPGTGSVVAANPTITTTYSVTGVTGICSGTAVINVSVNSTPTIIVSGSATVCAGSSTTLSASGAGSYTWLPGNLTGSTVTVSPIATTNYTIIGANGVCTSSVNFVLATIPVPTITPSASPTIICQGGTSTLSAIGALTYTWQPVNLTGASVTVSPLTTTIYTVSGTNLLGCSSSATVQLVVNNPTIVVSPLSGTLCSGQSATLSASGATSYTWNPGAFTTSSIVVSPTVNTTYTLTSVNGVCTSTTAIPILVSPTPTINASANPTAICVGGTATLTGSGGLTYTWNPGPLVGSNVTVSPLVNTTYTVAGTTINGCTSTKTVSLLVNPNPTITAISNPTNICNGSPALLTANGANTYTWAPVSSNSNTLVVTPSLSTTYSVSGTNSLGCVSSQTVSVAVTPLPTLTITGNPNPICRGNFSNLTGSGATSYTWLPGGANTPSIVVSPTATTVYTLVGMSGNCSSSKTYTLVVLPRPNITITALPPVICSGNPAVLLALGGISYTWTPGSSTGNTLIVTPSVTSSYTVTGSNLAGCTNTAVTTVSVNPNPTITAMPSATFVCPGNSVTIVSSGGVTYLVNPGAQTGPIVVVSPSVNTTYTVTGINNFGCTNSQTLTVNVGGSPSVTAVSSASLLCNGGSFSLTAFGAVNYTWMPVSVTGASIVTTATNSINTYSVIGESGGCLDTALVSVFVINCNNTMFGMTKAAGKPVLVYNSFYNVSFTVTAVNASTINLTNVTLNEDLATAFPMPSNFSVVSQPVITSQNSSLSINPLFDGISQISLTSPSTSTLLANKRDTIVFTVRIDPKGFYGPFKNWVIGFANFINNVTVMDTSNNGFTWDPDFDGDPTNNDTVTIISLPPIDLFIPDGFSPDGDGKNDVFFIKGLNGRPVKLTIFNRWGNKVYEKSEYDNSWNAYPNVANTIGSNKVPSATYYYIIEFQDGDKETRTGYVIVQY